MSDALFVKQLMLSSSGYWTLNKVIVKEFGLDSAFILSNLAEAEQLMADKDGWFYQTGDTLEEISGLSRYKQDLAIDKFVSEGMLEKDLRGIPAKRYFRFNYQKLANKLSKNLNTVVQNNSKLESKEFETNKELNINNLNKDMSGKPDERIPFKEIIDYLNENTGKNFKNVEGNKKVIRARWNEGNRLEDFKKVIDVKTSQWLNNKEMQVYLRPSTLFSSKFENYLNEVPRKFVFKEKSTDWEDQIKNLM